MTIIGRKLELAKIASARVTETGFDNNELQMRRGHLNGPDENKTIYSVRTLGSECRRWLTRGESSQPVRGDPMMDDDDDDRDLQNFADDNDVLFSSIGDVVEITSLEPPGWTSIHRNDNNNKQRALVPTSCTRFSDEIFIRCT